MITIDTESFEKQLLKDLKQYPKEIIPKASKAAYNRSAGTALVAWVRKASGLARIKVGLIRKRGFNKPTREGGRVIGILSNAIPADILGPKGKLPTQNKSGIKAGARSFKGAFIATMPTGKTSVFQRKGKKRLPIEKVTVPINNEVQASSGEARLSFFKTFPKNFESQLERFAARLKSARTR